MTSKIHRGKTRRCRCRIDCRTAAFWLAAFAMLLACRQAGAQLAPSDDFFNGGAQLYISNNVPAALERVENGLKIYPEDQKLKKLEQLLKQQQQNQQNQQQQQKQDQQKNQQQQNQQSSSQQNSQDQKKQAGQKQNQQKQDEQKKQEEQQKPAAEKKDEDKKDQQDQETQSVKVGQMTQQEATNRLDVLKNNEQLLQLKPQEKPHNPLRPVKDW